MIEIMNLNPNYFSHGIYHIYPLTNLSLNFLQRGQYNQDSQQYEPPSIEIYTKFSLTMYFLTFWILLALHSLTIFIADRCCMNGISNSATTWECIIHAFQKTSFPFPFSNWHDEMGSCQNLMKKKEESQREVLVAMLINLLFNMVMLIPLPILCKIDYNHCNLVFMYMMINNRIIFYQQISMFWKGTIKLMMS